MILDSKALFADALAHNGVSTVVNLGSAKAGPGNRPKIAIKGVGLAGVTGFTVHHGATDSAATLLETVIADSAALNAGVTYELPTNVLQYAKLTLTGSTSAGVWTAALQTEEGQTNL